MADPLNLVLTSAGLDALVNAQSGSTDPIRISQIALSEQPFVAAPTLVAVPGEFKRIASISGQSVSETVIHMTAQDSSDDIYDLTGFGLFLDDGTLFASYSQAETILGKTSVTSFLLSFDVAFADTGADAIEFGDATFLYPPASETVAGVLAIATQALVDGGQDDETAVTPLKLAQRLAEAFGAIVDATETVKGVAELATQAEVDTGVDDTRIVTPLKMTVYLAAEILAALEGVTIQGGGLISGGGDLTQNRILQLAAASVAEASAGQRADVALTPASIAGILAQIAALVPEARTITGTGLATGGGSLANNRSINVRAATAQEVRAGVRADSVITPGALGPILRSMGPIGYHVLPGADPASSLLVQWGAVTVPADDEIYVSYPVAFSEPAYAVADSSGASVYGVSISNAYIDEAGFRATNAGSSPQTTRWMAIGRIDLS